MKNREFYKEQIFGALREDGLLCNKFIKPKIIASYGFECTEIGCTYCNLLTSIWLEEEYKEPAEPEVDWTKVEVDTPILVKDYDESDVWYKRYFSKFEDGKVYSWSNGRTSWNGDDEERWNYAKLAEKEEE